MLSIEVEFLTGVSVAASPQNHERSEWPPHPDRLFQALVASWGRNEVHLEDETIALEWLETLDHSTLTISAPFGHFRDLVTVFVPPNDAHTSVKSSGKFPKNTGDAMLVIPEFRKNKQPRTFPTIIPASERAIVRYLWSKATGLEYHLNALNRLAHEVTYLGHPHSLVRVTVSDVKDGETMAENLEWLVDSKHLRLPHKGRLLHLRNRYLRSIDEGRIVRPSQSLVTRTFEPKSAGQNPSTLFNGRNVTVLSDDGGFVPELSSFPIVAKRLRDALLTCVPKGISIPSLISGHDGQRNPIEGPHLAILPLADVGWNFSEGRLMGVALVWPKQVIDSERKTALATLSTFLGGMERTGLLHFGNSGSWSIRLGALSDKASLRFDRYLGPSKVWGTVLPAVLDRYPKDKRGSGVADIVTTACINVGLLRDDVTELEIETHRHSPVKGAPPVKEVIDSLPNGSPYRQRPMMHLVLRFPRPIVGPLILGAGRFRGLGFCLPLVQGEIT